MTTFDTAAAEARRHLMPFESARVADAMHPGVLTCPPETSLRTVARMMATYGVHAIVVTPPDPEGESSERGWAMVSDLDLAKAAALGHEDATAGGMARTPLVTIAPGESMKRAAQVFLEEGVSHLVVTDRDGERAIGVVSTQDLAACLATRPPAA